MVSSLCILFPGNTTHVSFFCSRRAAVQTSVPYSQPAQWARASIKETVTMRAVYQAEANLFCVLNLWKSERKQSPISQLKTIIALKVPQGVLGGYPRCPGRGDRLPCAFSGPHLRITCLSRRVSFARVYLGFYDSRSGRQGEEETWGNTTSSPQT